MKKVLVVLAIAAMCGSIAQASYESGSCTSGSISGSFSNAVFVVGLGWSSSGGRSVSFSGSCSACNNAIGIYGWMCQSPAVEYYVGASGGTSKGTYSCNGRSYTLYTQQVNSAPSVCGGGNFVQYNANGSKSSPIDMSCHFSAWQNLGMPVGSYNYMVVNAESWSNQSGNYNISVSGSSWYTKWVNAGSVSLSCGGGGSTTTTTSGGSTTTTSGGGGGTVVVRARGTAGSESVTAFGSTWTLGTGMSNHSISTSATSGTVCFTNDASGRDVQVDYVVIQGSTRQAESQSYNTGVYQNSKCGGSYSEWLNCNGCIGF
ncbi:MAG: glycoside hydrolase family 11 protein [Sedimentisphaerales bacterium]